MSADSTNVHGENSGDGSEVGRRGWLKGMAAASLASLGGNLGPDAGECQAAERDEQPRRMNRIVEENQKPGATDWQLTRVRLDKTGGFRSPWIEGYCSRQSVAAGDTIEIGRAHV